MKRGCVCASFLAALTSIRCGLEWYTDDITVGQNNCGAFLCCPADAGFFASKGWDPLTGLGSPGDFDVLVAAAMAA